MTIHLHRTRARIAAIAAATVLAGTLLPAGTTGAQAADPPVVPQGLVGSVTTISRCDGEVTTQINGALLKVERPDDVLTGEIQVDVTYGGSLVNGVDYPALPDPITIPDGDYQTFLEAEATRPGTITLTVEPGAGYTVGSPATATVEIVDVQFVADCPAPDVQTIEVGDLPTGVDVYETYGGELLDTTLVVEGTLPPGVDYTKGGFSGAATTVGTYEFSVNFCLGDLCALEMPFVVTVVPAGTLAEPPPTEPAAPPAPPAAPVQGDATFTG